MFDSHKKIERNVFILITLTIIVTSIGAIIEILPLFKQEVAIERVQGMRPYTPLELAGFEIYKREGCYGCHSQQVRALRDEVERYGHYSLAAESMYDFPFAWGSKRTGPDLARVGGKYSDDWHIAHLINPRALISTSIMPSYAFIYESKLDHEDIQKYMSIYKSIGVPYSDVDITRYYEDMLVQTSRKEDPESVSDFQMRYPKVVIHKSSGAFVSEMDALVAYLQAIGTMVDLKSNQGRDW